MEAMGTRRISSDIEDCIQVATKFVLIVSPYLKIAPSLYERMLDKLDEYSGPHCQHMNLALSKLA
jgi:hypothetical protein